MKASAKVIFLGAMIFASCADANDSTARAGAGGLELLKTENIQMVSEVLEVSTSKVRVTYHFLNTSDHDIKTTVAFPMPAFDSNPERDDNQRPLDSFQIFVNGEKVSVNKNRVFLINNLDVTDRLRKIGLSDELIFDPRFKCMQDYLDSDHNNGCPLATEQFHAIQKLDAKTDGIWQIQETAYWEQTFPAGKEIEVVHEYKPFVGWNPDGTLPGNATVTDGCLDDRTLKAIKRKIRESDSGPVVLEDVEYILGTGRNWRGPIKNFKLVVKKESPDDIVSLCFPGKPVKTSATTIEFSQSNFVPQDKLLVLFYCIGTKSISAHMRNQRNR